MSLSVDVLFQELQFRPNNVSASWGIFDRDSPIVRSNTRSLVYTSSCNTANNSVAVNTTNNFATIPFDGEGNTYFNLTAFDEDGEQIATINEPFRINSGGKF